MHYAILAYHVETEVTSWTPEQDAAVMTGLLQVHDRFYEERSLGPSARLGATEEARTLRGPGGMVIDGPFAETKEQLLGLYIVDCADEAAAGIARDLRRVNPGAVYEIRPIQLYLPGVPFPVTRAKTVTALAREQQPACGTAQGYEPHHRNNEKQIFASHKSSGLRAGSSTPVEQHA